MSQLLKKIILLVLFLTVGNSYAAGLIDLIEGNVSITNGQGELRVPARGDQVEVGDLITTGHNGELHIITDDNGLLALRPDTTLKIDTYRADGGQNDNISLRLLRGSFRSIPGWIGKKSSQNYIVRTSTATIGIGGADCEPLVVEDGPNAGTYAKVNKGETLLDTPSGKLSIGANQAGFVAKSGMQDPKILNAISPLFKTARNENAIETSKVSLEKSLDQKLKERQHENVSKSVDSQGKPKIGDIGEGGKAATALDEILRAYEAGNTGFIRGRLDPSMIGFEKLMDGIIVEANQCKQMRINLLDTQVQAGPDLAVIQTNWEKRCLQLPNFAARLDSGHSTFLMHRTAGGWNMVAVSGSNPLASLTYALATINSRVTPGTCALINALVGGASANAPITITINDPDLANVSSITVKVNWGADVESFNLPSIATGVFQQTTFPVRQAIGVSGDGFVNIQPVGGICAAATVSYVDTTTNYGAQTVIVSVPIP
jgi:hypothetical protein